MKRTLSFFAASALILVPMIVRGDDDDSPGQKAKDVIRGIGQGIREAVHDDKQPADVDVSLGQTHMDMPTSVDAGELTFKVTTVGTENRQFKISGPGLERYFAQPLLRKNLTQRRKDAKERQKPGQQEFTTETQRTMRSEARGLTKIC